MATVKKIYNGYPSVASATIVTAATGKKTIIKEIIATNKSANQIKLTIKADGVEIVGGKIILPNDLIVFALSTVLDAGDVIAANVDANAGDLSLTISGVEI